MQKFSPILKAEWSLFIQARSLTVAYLIYIIYIHNSHLNVLLAEGAVYFVLFYGFFLFFCII